MRPKPIALALAMMAAVGCTLTHSGLRHDAVSPPLDLGTKSKGKVIEPKRCDIRVAVLSRAVGDKALDEGVWKVADEQVLEPELRHAVESNGLRFGVITGSLPHEVEQLLNAPPPHQVKPTEINIPSGDNTLISTGAAVQKVSLILNRDNRATGKDYSDATGYFRMTGSYDASAGVTLRIVPELHHGPIQQRFTADSSTNPYSLQQFIIKEGQQEETLRELAASVTVQPGQIVVIGCRHERERSLGHFLLTEPELGSDRLLQKVVLVWAAQGHLEGSWFTSSPATPNPPKSVTPSSAVPSNEPNQGRGRSK